MGETAVDIAGQVRAGGLTARQAVERALQAIEDRDAPLQAFQEVRAFAALREADDVDRRSDRPTLPLAGVPIAIKDNVSVAGEPMREGSLGTDPAPKTEDHPIVRRLREAGAVVVGITRVPELCVYGTTDSQFGVTANPWDRSRTPGGSSGGSAAAVAAGMVPVAHGNDGLGSIRIPAACCGLVGIKPGLGLVPSGLGGESWFDMAENGPLATTVADAALVLSVMAGRPELGDVRSPRALRIALSVKAPMPATPVNAHWAAAAREAGTLLRGAGHTVRPADPPYSTRMAASNLVRWVAGTELNARELADRSKLAVRTRRHAALGKAALRVRLPRKAGRLNWQRAAERFFADHDVLLTPTLAQPPLEAGGWAGRGWLRNVWVNARYAPFAAPWNLAGWPAMAVPAGLAPDGLPLSVQLVSRPGTESLLLGLAATLERLRPWPRTAPPGRS